MSSYEASLNRGRAGYVGSPAAARTARPPSSKTDNEAVTEGLLVRLMRNMGTLIHAAASVGFFTYLCHSEDPKFDTNIATTILGMYLTAKALLFSSSNASLKWIIFYWIVHSLASCLDAYFDEDIFIGCCMAKSLTFYVLFRQINSIGATFRRAYVGCEASTQPLTQSISMASRHETIQSPFQPSTYMNSPTKLPVTPFVASPIDELMMRKNVKNNDSLLMHSHIGNLDMTSTPAHEIHIDLRDPRPAQKLILNNNITENIVFAFKTNVPERIKVTPHSGVLKMGEEREITISLARNADLTDLRKRGSDKLAVEYIQVGDRTDFTSNFYSLDPEYKYRHCFRVFYDDVVTPDESVFTHDANPHHRLYALS
ncbi:hypothetical protein WR25_06598 [Diploscapter pachys]|uniref:Major sperm protein n=1 Tax=Diploscapter pachys TaxID=2018661 RepID=A0A2A2KSZ1_9BILA|nr:hypothetical protein WR25_06598 [Diploscapter pachys]